MSMFVLPFEPATPEDAALLDQDFLAYGFAVMTKDGKRIDPWTLRPPCEEADRDGPSTSPRP